MRESGYCRCNEKVINQRGLMKKIVITKEKHTHSYFKLNKNEKKVSFERLMLGNCRIDYKIKKIHYIQVLITDFNQRPILKPKSKAWIL